MEVDRPAAQKSHEVLHTLLHTRVTTPFLRLKLLSLFSSGCLLVWTIYIQDDFDARDFLS